MRPPVENAAHITEWIFSALPKHTVTMTEPNMYNHQQECHCERNF
jgi:hypothetical protein